MVRTRKSLVRVAGLPHDKDVSINTESFGKKSFPKFTMFSVFVYA